MRLFFAVFLFLPSVFAGLEIGATHQPTDFMEPVVPENEVNYWYSLFTNPLFYIALVITQVFTITLGFFIHTRLIKVVKDTMVKERKESEINILKQFNNYITIPKNELSEKEEDDKNDERLNAGGICEEEVAHDMTEPKGRTEGEQRIRANYENIPLDFLECVANMTTENAFSIGTKNSYQGPTVQVSREFGQIIVHQLKKFMPDDKIVELYGAEQSGFCKKDLAFAMEFESGQGSNCRIFLQTLCHYYKLKYKSSGINKVDRVDKTLCPKLVADKGPKKTGKVMVENVSTSIPPQEKIQVMEPVYIRHTPEVLAYLNPQNLEVHYKIDGAGYNTYFCMGTINNVPLIHFHVKRVWMIDGIRQVNAN